ncbi:splicing factor [Capsaspora owczarzaki ATCC 30864]|uniref:Splicing factor n=1 Tax=Capsaspora owczarzaki (strain ATCC 30864) TaxID=595528 RepID=A0A0D2VGZ3_CAPO3|nr:splicing factor [Capsaspora owczarzaki ATCC 30864]
MSDDQTPPAVAAAPRPAVHPDRLGNFAPGSVSADRSGGSENSDRRDDDDRDRRDQRDQRDQRDHRGGRDDRDRGGYDDYRGDTRGRPSAGGRSDDGGYRRNRSRSRSPDAGDDRRRSRSSRSSRRDSSRGRSRSRSPHSDSEDETDFDRALQAAARRRREDAAAAAAASAAVAAAPKPPTQVSNASASRDSGKNTGGAKAAQISSNRAGEGSHSVASNANVGLAPPGSNEAVMMASGEDGDEMEDPDLEVMRMMGISGFGSTKGKHVPGADVSAAAIKQPRRYRQYMNRRGGFNRPLDQIK